MKTIESKRLYAAPELLKVALDNEISLALQSATPPDTPWGGGMGDSHYEPTNTFKDPIA